MSGSAQPVPPVDAATMKLSVNLNKVALLRNSRGAKNPSPLVAAARVLDAGAHGVTLHWREDNRHALRQDAIAVRALCADRARGEEFNLEGDPRDELIELALSIRPDQVTLVPVTPGEITSDHGWDLPADRDRLSPVLARLKAAGIRTAIFLDAAAGPAAATRINAAAATGCDRIEIYTEPYAASFGTPSNEQTLTAVRDTARVAAAAGLGSNAGHDLDLHNLPRLAREVPEIVEVSIGHALVADALYLGLDETIARYLAATRGELPAKPPPTT